MAIIHTEFDEKMTRKGATSLIRNLRCTKGSPYFYICGNFELPIDGEEGRCFPGYQPLRVNRAQAIRFVQGLLSETLENRGARIRIKVDAPSENYGAQSVWIG